MSRPASGIAGDGARTGSTGSFHAGAPIPALGATPSRRLSSHRYQTFPAPPSKSSIGQAAAKKVLDETQPIDSDSVSDDGSRSDHEGHDESPLPVRQLMVLAFLSLAEQTALNSISPYLPSMVASMDGIPAEESGLYVGILASAFALAQLSTNFLWGYGSDIIGRKPVLLLGTVALMLCFAVFGLCQTYWHIVVVHVAMGMLNGNAACVPTVLGEITDRSNQSRAFAYLPIIYSLGSITGPALGGLLVNTMGQRYPYLGPNILSAALLAVSCVVIALWFEETLEEAQPMPSFTMPMWLRRLTWWLWPKPKRFGAPGPALSRTNSWSTRWPRSYSSADATRPLLVHPTPKNSEDDDDDDEDSDTSIREERDSSRSTSHSSHVVWSDISNRTTAILLATYLVFQLTNISFNSLYPIFASFPAPHGRDLDPSKIGVSLSLAGLATIGFQAFLYQRLKAKVGNLGSYRLALLGISATMIMMPWVGYTDGNAPFGIGSNRLWLYFELAFILVVKNICAVGGLSSVMLLITNSAPSHACLGTLNGMAQTLSALGRSIGPFVSGALFTLSTNIKPKGEALPWCLFGGLAFLGWLGSIFIARAGLESDDWEGYSDEEDNDSGHHDRNGL
ncbi:Sugar (and other) transporter [Geosmithia morbida]|uniref:Sugar (And other) transporter n=1 Tax=Geosmithia morbida TaxID=1094350 RepID=A0A9P4YW62_9HYPO|nr:Sugar (and other) transporter [Geosmithia morbida]KAF4122889.1 Sugar (and other) transporter [Geosmithia morbida]